MKTKARRISTLITLVLLVAVMVFGVVAIPAFAAEETKEQSGFFTKDPKDPSTYAYSMAVVGDTQTLSDSDYNNRNTDGYVKRMDTLYNWISNNIEAKKIGLVLGLGDIVENWENPLDFPTYEGKEEGNQSIWEWENAGRVFNAYLEDANGVKVPYTLVRGNHDSDNAYNAFIASSVMSDYRAQYSGENAGFYVDSKGKTKYDTSFMKLTLGTTNWLVITLDWGVTERELDWAAELISTNSGHRVILTMHNYLFHDRTVDSVTGSAASAMPNPNWDYNTDMLANNKTAENPEGPVYNADGIWERLASRYENIDLVLSGHVPNDAPQRSQLVGANGKTITQILIDPQSMDLAAKNTSGTGMVAMLYFNDDGSLADTQWDEKTVDLEWYSTIKDKYFKTANQYTLNLDLYDGGVKTENYGTIPAEYADEKTYPFVVFGHDTDIDEYFFLGAYNSWTQAYSSLGVIAGTSGKDALGCILLRDDYVFEDSTYQLHRVSLKSVTLDLGGNTVTTTTNNTPFFASNVATENSYVMNVLNGTFVNGSEYRAFITTGCDAGSNGSSFTYNFSGVTFKFAENAATTKLVAETFTMDKGNLTNTQYLNFDNCTFDLTNKPDKTVTLFSMCEDNSGSYTTQNAHINITNSSVVGDVTNVVAVKKNDTDSFKAEIGGDAQFVGEYGFVPSNVMSNASTNPFVFFNGDAANGYIYYSAGKLSSLRKKTTSATSATTIDDYANYVGKTACLIAENYTLATAINPLYIDGEFVIDLCGNTLSRNGAYLFDTISHQATVGENTTKVTIKNGSMNSIDKWFIAFNNNTLTTAHKFFELTFDKVTFKYNSTSARADGAFINAWAGNDDADNYGLNTSIQFNDCIYDFTNAPKNAVMFNFKGADAVCESDVIATFNGGEIITSDANAGWRLFTTDLSEKKNAKDGKDTANEIHFNNGKDGTPLKIKVSNTTAANQPNATHYYEATDADYCFKKAADGSYHLSKAYFDLLDSSLVLSGKYAAWNDVFAAAMKLSNSTILLLDNAEVVSEQGTVGTYQNTVTVDLNGKTLYKAGDKYIVSTYYSNTGASNTKITFKNGELNKTAGKYGFFCANYTSEANKNTEVANLDFQFDNVTFTHTYSGSGVNEFIFSLFENGYSVSTTKGTHTDAVFNNCTFNYRGEIFKLNHSKDSEGANKSVFNIVINGGKLVPMAGAETRPTLFSKDSKDTVTFAKTEGGEYTRIIVPATAAAPTYEFNGLKFAKESENGTTTTYILVPSASIGLDFTPKASVTLDSTLIFNIYLPDHAGLGAVTLNGETVALGEANDGYYVISTPLMASESAEELKLVVNLTVDGTSLKGSFTFSTVKYAEKLLATAGISAAEQTLAKDMLAYINSAYVFFNGSAVAEITALLDGYASKAVETTDAKQTVPGLSGATFTLEAKPTVQFFFAEGFGYEDFTFKVGGRTLTVADVEEKTDEYVKFALFAYEMTETFSYTVGGESGEYNLIAYYAYASGTGENDYKGDDKAELTDLAAKFYNYCASAKAYRASVIGK